MAAFWMAGDAAMDEWNDDNPTLEDGVDEPEESKGVHSEAGMLAMPALAMFSIWWARNQHRMHGTLFNYLTKNISMEE